MNAIQRAIEALEMTLPRYQELYEAADLGDPSESVVVEKMRVALAELRELEVVEGWIDADERESIKKAGGLLFVPPTFRASTDYPALLLLGVRKP